MQKTFINIYKDTGGRFISDVEYSTYNDAYENRDYLSTYVETVEIIRNGQKARELPSNNEFAKRHAGQPNN